MPGNLSVREDREKESNEQNMFRRGVLMGRFFIASRNSGAFVLLHSLRLSPTVCLDKEATPFSRVCSEN
jgi:hypothetical protein